MELKKYITDERTGIGYTVCGDNFLPDLNRAHDLPTYHIRDLTTHNRHRAGKIHHPYIKDAF